MADTPLDRAHALMEAAPADDAQRLSYFGHLARAELFVLLEREAPGDTVELRTFPLEGASYVVAFDTEDRLAAFAGPLASWAALSGRTLAPMLAAEGLGLMLNPEVARSFMVLPPDALAWLAATLAAHPGEAEARPVSVAPPAGVPEALLAALDAGLATATGRAREAWLVAVAYADGREGHLLAFAGAVPGAEQALAGIVGEALTFSGLAAGEIDVVFLAASDPVLARIAKVGLRFDLPQPASAAAPEAPGSDPDRPPRLR
jgi:hypothetical protein